MSNENEKFIAEIIAGAEKSKPRLLVEPASPDRTVAALRDQLAAQGNLFDRGVPVRLAYNQTEGGTLAQTLTADESATSASSRSAAQAAGAGRSDRAAPLARAWMQAPELIRHRHPGAIGRSSTSTPWLAALGQP
jgi:hypothetical protein